MDNKRLKKVSGLLQEEMSRIIQREGPSFYGTKCLVTITNVVVTSDLSTARFYFSVFNADDPDEVLRQIAHHGNRLRGELGNLVRHQLRKIPELEFYKDDTLDYVFKMDQIFDQIEKDRASLKGDKSE
jgi:ribosome-binding factor A